MIHPATPKARHAARFFTAITAYFVVFVAHRSRSSIVEGTKVASLCGITRIQRQNRILVIENQRLRIYVKAKRTTLLIREADFGLSFHMQRALRFHVVPRF